MAEANKVHEPEWIRLKMKVVGQENVLASFKVCKHATMRQLMDAYYDLLKLPKDTVLFLYDGHIINENDTVTTMAMQDNDIIDAYQEKMDG